MEYYFSAQTVSDCWLMRVCKPLTFNVSIGVLGLSRLSCCVCITRDDTWTLLWKQTWTNVTNEERPRFSFKIATRIFITPLNFRVCSLSSSKIQLELCLRLHSVCRFLCGEVIFVIGCHCTPGPEVSSVHSDILTCPLLGFVCSLHWSLVTGQRVPRLSVTSGTEFLGASHSFCSLITFSLVERVLLLVLYLCFWFLYPSPAAMVCSVASVGFPRYAVTFTNKCSFLFKKVIMSMGSLPTSPTPKCISWLSEPSVSVCGRNWEGTEIWPLADSPL